MSQENVEIIRRGYEHFTTSGGDIRAHPDLIWDVSNLGWPEQQIYHGPEGAMQFNAEWAAAWDDWEMLPEDYIEAGERVVVILIQRGRSKEHGDSRRDALRSSVDAPGRTGDRDAAVRERGLKPSKPWGCRRRTLAPTPDSARTERRWNRTIQEWGCHPLPVLKTGWATRPLPLRAPA